MLPLIAGVRICSSALCRRTLSLSRSYPPSASSGFVIFLMWMLSASVMLPAATFPCSPAVMQTARTCTAPAPSITKSSSKKSDLPGIPCHTTVIPGIPGHFHDRLCLRCLPAGYSIITAGAVQILPNRRSNKCLRQDVLDVLRINPCQFICNRLQVICRPCAFPPVRFRCYPAFIRFKIAIKLFSLIVNLRLMGKTPINCRDVKRYRHLRSPVFKAES